MKKIMIMLGIAVATAFAQASTIKWSVSEVYKVDGSAKAGNTYTMLCFFSSDSTKAWTTISVADAVAAIKSKSISESKVATSGTLFNGGKSTSNIGSFATGDVIGGFAIIIDSTVTKADGTMTFTGAKNYMVVDTSATKTFMSDSAAETFNFGSQKANTWYSIPEPTSGLLLLLGVAGLALKRKRV